MQDVVKRSEEDVADHETLDYQVAKTKASLQTNTMTVKELQDVTGDKHSVQHKLDALKVGNRYTLRQNHQ